MNTLKINTCPECRKSMRCWALDWKREQDPEVKRLCLSIAIDFRSGECFHGCFLTKKDPAYYYSGPLSDSDQAMIDRAWERHRKACGSKTQAR